MNKIISDGTESFVSGFSESLVENENIRAEVKRRRGHLIGRVGVGWGLEWWSHGGEPWSRGSRVR